MAKQDKLFEQFPPVTTAEWMQKIHSDLKGADFNKKLVWKTNEGFEVMPFYRSEDIDNLNCINISGEFPYLRGSKIHDNNWLIRQDIDVQDYSASNRKALDILNKGVSSLGFNISDPESVNKENFSILLNDIQLKAAETNFLCNGKAKEILEILAWVSLMRGLDRYELNGAIEADPLGRLMVNGKLCISPVEGFDYLASLTHDSLAFPNLRTVHIRASDFGNAGAGIVQELAFGISMGNEYMAQLTDRGLSGEESASKIRFSFGISSNYFFEIARLRAARLLWSIIQKGYDKDAAILPIMKIHCVTSAWNKTAYDPYVNMLRTQTESMSAVIGGADSITVEPFDSAYKNPNEFSERIARNQQLILREEAHLDKVADPGAGSYYIEKLTEMIADQAWKQYLEIEEQGGFLKSLQSGFIQKKISVTAENKRKEVAFRKTILLGTNQYPMPDEHLADGIDRERLFKKNNILHQSEVDPVVHFRGSEEYEKIRLAVEDSGKKPIVFLFTIGNPLMRRARAQFSAGFFGYAGYKIKDNNGFDSVNDGIKSAKEANADIVVVCSSDEEYPVVAPEIFNALKDKAIIVIAGNPSSVDDLKAKGIEHFIHMKTNVPESLNEFNKRLGIAGLNKN
jgi:methylmalonyl-CoA mutase